jgi:hypothetical protein
MTGPERAGSVVIVDGRAWQKVDRTFWKCGERETLAWDALVRLGDPVLLGTAAEWADRMASRLNKLAEAAVHPARAQGPHPRTDDAQYLNGYQAAIRDLRALGES